MAVDTFTFLRMQGYEGTPAQMVTRYNLDAKKGNTPLILDGQATVAGTTTR